MKKFLPYILILVVMFGLFGVTGKASAADLQTGSCVSNNSHASGTGYVPVINLITPEQYVTKGVCQSKVEPEGGGIWTPKNPDGPAQIITAQTSGIPTTQDQEKKTPFEDAVSDQSCNALNINMGCIVKLLYLIFYLPSTFLLWLSAQFFNALISISLNGDLLSQTFVNSAWGVVRDLSNIFFILILLYAAFETILGMSHDTKKIIADVIIVALLINFSMFFTKVVIDSSNVLALVFYNKLSVTGKDGKPIGGTPVTGEKERNISGALYYSFNPTKLLTPEFFEATKTNDTGIPGSGDKAKSDKVAPGILLGIIIISVAIMFFAAYCFFASGIFFVGRLIELFILTIFSPFAFISFAIPQLKGQDYVGWDSWKNRLVKVAFMAPIFMFFMYFIFMLLKADLFSALIPGKSLVQTILGVVLPALLILILLLKATDFAKKGSGSFGDALMKGAKVVGGLALGAATGGAALVGTGVVGGWASKMASSEKLKEAAKEKGFSGWAARKAIKVGDYGSKASFDFRKSSLGQTFAKNTGINMERSKIIGLGSKEGGFKGAVERKVKEFEEESKLYKTSKSDKEVQEWSQAELDKYETAKNEARTKRMENGPMGPAAMKEWEEEYDKKYTKPKDYTKIKNAADTLNHDRMKAYQENIGQDDLMSGLIHSAMVKTGDLVTKENYKESKKYKKWEGNKQKEKIEAVKREGGEVDKDGKIIRTGNFDETRFNRIYDAEHPAPTADSINSDAKMRIKLLAGTALGLAGGGIVGGVLGNAVAGGVTVSAANTAINKTVNRMVNKSAIGTFSKGLEKEHAQEEKVGKRIKANTEALEKLHKILEEGKTLDLKDEEGKTIENMVTGNKSDGFTVDQGKIERALANLVFIAKREDIKLKKLIEQGDGDSEEARNIQRELVKNTIQTAKLNKLKTAEQDVESLNQQLYNLGKDKSALHDKEHAKEDKHDKVPATGGHSTKPEAHPAPETASTPASEGGHGATHGGH